MAERIRVRPRAQADIDEQVRYLRDEAGWERALAFLDALSHLLQRLAAFPQLGPPWPTRQRRLLGLRRAVLPAFRVSVFYSQEERWIEVIRVLHHARHLPPLLEDV